MKPNPPEINRIARSMSIPGRVIAVLFLLFLAAVAGHAGQQEVFEFKNPSVLQNGASLTATSQGLLPAAPSYTYQISGAISGKGAFSGYNNGNPKDFGRFLDSIQTGFSANLSGTNVVKTSGTTILSGTTISGQFLVNSVQVDTKATFSLGINAAGTAIFSITNVSFMVGGAPFTTGSFVLSGTGTITANLPPTPAITSPATATGMNGVAFSYVIAATNNPTSFGATGMPPGLTVSGATGIISGTPTQSGTFPATISAINANGTGSAALSITILSGTATSPAITSPGTATGMNGVAFSYQITATNNPTSFGASGLPLGLSVNATTGLILGTPTQSGTFPATISAINASGTGSESRSPLRSSAERLRSPWSWANLSMYFPTAHT